MRIIKHAVVTCLVALAAQSWAVPVAFDNATATFESNGQSMWGSGQAATLDVNRFIGTSWSGSAANLDLMLGSRTWNPGYYRDNSIAVGAWETCNFVTIGNCGSRPPAEVWVPGSWDDNRRGFEGSASAGFRTGIEVGLSANSGSVDSNVAFDVALDVPEDVNAGDFIQLTGSSNLIDGSLDSTFPTLSASLSVVAEANASFRGTSCGLILGGNCSNISENRSFGGTQEVISFNEDGEGGIEYFDGNRTLNALLNSVADPAQGFPVTASSSIASSTIYLPQPNVQAGLNADGSISGRAADDLLDYSLDVDNIVATAAGAPGAFGSSFEFGPVEVGYNLIDVQIGPQLDLEQSFEFTPRLYVDFAFSQAVDVLGFGSVTTLTNQLWNALPQFAFTEGVTWVTPTLFLGFEQNGVVQRGVELLNELFIDVNGNFNVRALEAWATANFLIWDGTYNFGIGEVYDTTFDIFSTPALFSSLFGLGGFNDFTLSQFAVATAGYVPGLPPVVDVPEPSTWTLLFLGLFTLILHRRLVRRRGV